MEAGQFQTAREAKEYLVSRIVEEAKSENVSLSEIERKMLYFSETHWTLPDMMEVSEQFDREYDQDEYEKKITRLARNVIKHDLNESPQRYEAWRSAVQILESEDHYILVAIDARSGVGIDDLLGNVDTPGPRPRWDQLKLFLLGLSVATVLVAFPFLKSLMSQRYVRYLPSGDGWAFYLLVIGLFAVLAYRLGWLTFGDQAGKERPYEASQGDKKKTQ